MEKFYFTYGSSGQPYVGGWTEIIAPDRHTACEIFNMIHPPVNGNLLNCSSCYSAKEFEGRDMHTNGNFGSFCHERITLTLEYPEN